MNQLLSIITRTYGARASQLRQTIRWVSAQTYRPIEWIVVEDGSESAQAVLHQIEPDPGLVIRYVPIPKAGRSAAANAGLDTASGEYLCILDDDDEIFPSHAATLIDLLRSHPRAAASYAASLRSQTMKAQGDTAASVVHEEVFLSPTIDSTPLAWHNIFPIQAVVFRAHAAADRRFDLNLDALEDWLFWLQVLFGKKLVWTPEITSRFFVPARPAEQNVRMQQHSSAYERFSSRRKAFLSQLGCEDIRALQMTYRRRALQALFAAADSTGVRGETLDPRRILKS